MKKSLMQLSLFSLVAACSSSSSEQPATFAGATDQQLTRTAAAALSIDSVMVSFLAAGYASAPDGQPCPNLTSDQAGRRHVHGGCSTDDGQQLSGELVLENVQGLFGPPADPARQSVIEADDFAQADEAQVIRADGRLAWSQAGTEAAIEVDLFGIAVRSDSAFSCTGTTCTYSSSNLDIDGLGTAQVTGSFDLAQGLATIDVIGVDTLHIASDGKCTTLAVGARKIVHCNANNAGFGALRDGLQAQGTLQPR